MKRLLFALTILISSGLASAASVCQGKFPNPIDDICWDCALPITIFSMPIATPSGENADYSSANLSGLEKVMCTCTSPLGLPKTGVPVSFWEFARQIDVTRTPYCLVGLGKQMNVGINGDIDAGKSSVTIDDQRSVFRHVHWYVNPLMGLMGAVLDMKCLEPRGFDLAYVSELDKTWIDEEASRLLAPEAYLFNNIVAQIGCAADCVAATAGLTGVSNLLYWCAGCNGSLYPLDGWVSSTDGTIKTAALLTQRMIAKQHRMLTQFSTAGKDAMCAAGKIQPVMDKRQYKYQLLYPVPQATPKDNGIDDNGGKISSCCQPVGRSTFLFGSGRIIPYKGEDVSIGIFRKRDCCQI